MCEVYFSTRFFAIAMRIRNFMGFPQNLCLIMFDLREKNLLQKETSTSTFSIILKEFLCENPKNLQSFSFIFYKVENLE